MMFDRSVMLNSWFQEPLMWFEVAKDKELLSKLYALIAYPIMGLQDALTLFGVAVPSVVK